MWKTLLSVVLLRNPATGEARFLCFPDRLLTWTYVSFPVLHSVMQGLRLLSRPCATDVLFGICRYVMCLFGLWVGLSKIPNLMRRMVLVMLISLSGTCRLGPLELQWCTVLVHARCGKGLVSLILVILWNMCWTTLLMKLRMLCLAVNVNLTLSRANLGRWLVCRLLLWK